MKKRDTQHYIEMFRESDTVGPNLLADAIHVARGGEGGAPRELVRAALRMHGEALDGARAAMLVADEAARSSSASDFGARLKTLRTKRNLTQGDLAHLSGLTARAMRYLESGEREPSLSTLRALGAAMGIDVGTLLGE